MYIELFDRSDRLGSNILYYVCKLIYAHKFGRTIIYAKGDRSQYKYHDSPFVSCLFDFIDKQNNNLLALNPENDKERDPRWYDKFRKDDQHNDEHDNNLIASFVTICIEEDVLHYFITYILPSLPDLQTIANEMNWTVPDDIDRTILVHLRLEDVTHRPDYDGSVCSSHFAERINRQDPIHIYYMVPYNQQAPLSKEKIETQIFRAVETYPDHKVVLITTPGSDTSFLPYDVLRNDDPNYDLFLLCMCPVVILSKSTFSLASLFFSRKNAAYVPMWGHFACCGLTTNYDQSHFQYFY